MIMSKPQYSPQDPTNTSGVLRVVYQPPICLQSGLLSSSYTQPQLALLTNGVRCGDWTSSAKKLYGKVRNPDGFRNNPIELFTCSSPSSFSSN